MYSKSNNLSINNINNNCYKCIYSRIDNNHISCIKHSPAIWVNCPDKCEKIKQEEIDNE